jgi:two-component system nitrate/nitrite response regulator NarL
VRIIIVTNTRVIFDAVRISLSVKDEVSVVVLAGRIGETFIRLSEQVFDVCLLDLDLPGATIAIPELKEYWPSMRVVSLGEGHHDEPSRAEGGVETLKRQATVNEIAAILTAQAPRIDAPLSAAATPVQTGAHDANLSLRESQIATFLARGLSNKVIARELSIQPSTVKNHVHNILEKLEISNRAKVAGRLGMLRPTSA